MESLVLKEILNGNNVVIALGLIAIFRMHKEAMGKITKLTDSVSELITVTRVHATELEHGDKRFEKVEKEIETLRERQHKFSDILQVEFPRRNK